MKVFLTGADGFIGSHLCEALVREGHEVTALALYNSFGDRGWLESVPIEILRSVRVVLGDVRDSGQMRQLIRGQDAVCHLAALIAIPYSYQAPESYIETNIKGTLNILQACRDYDVQKVLQTSTSEVYGTAQFVPITETHPVVGQSPYSATKIAADQLAISFFRSFQLPVSIIRPFNTFGPRQSARAFIPSVIVQIAKQKKTLQLGSLHPTRDFNFVSDTANGFIKALSSDQILGETINLASNFEISMKETAELIAEIMGAKVDFREDPSRVRPEASEVERLYGDNTKARQLLNWNAEFGGKDGFRKALAKTVDWFCVPKNAEKYKADIYNL